MTQPWYPFYWSDYSGKTLHLSQGQHGAYMLLLRYIYTTEKPIPHKSRYSIAMAMLDDERSNVDSVLTEFFELRENSWHSKKAEIIIAEVNEKHKRRVESGAKGGIAKSSNARAMPAKKPSNALLTTTTPTPIVSNDTITLPVWMPLELWQTYLEVRRKKRANNADKVLILIIAKLESWYAKGHDPAAILSKSITSNWTDIFEPREDAYAKQQPKQTKFDLIAQGIADARAARERDRSGQA